jgi:hypothetical protein
MKFGPSCVRAVERNVRWYRVYSCIPIVASCECMLQCEVTLDCEIYYEPGLDVLTLMAINRQIFEGGQI